jgi:hypothetical protein
MRPTRKPRNSPRFTIWRTVSAEQSQRSASMSGVTGRGMDISVSHPLEEGLGSIPSSRHIQSVFAWQL